MQNQQTHSYNFIQGDDFFSVITVNIATCILYA